MILQNNKNNLSFYIDKLNTTTNTMKHMRKKLNLYLNKKFTKQKKIILYE